MKFGVSITVTRLCRILMAKVHFSRFLTTFLEGKVIPPVLV